MKKPFTIEIITILSVLICIIACRSTNQQNCFPNEPVAKIEILVADTTILGKFYVPDNDTSNTCTVYHGVGFVNKNGKIFHKPLKRIVLTSEGQKDFLKILRPVPNQNEGTITDCFPIYRHVVLFYNQQNKLIGQLHICFSCMQVWITPDTNCLNFFAENRLSEITQFFKKNDIPVFSF